MVILDGGDWGLSRGADHTSISAPYRAGTDENSQEAFDDAACANNPGHPDEEDDTKDVLDGGEVDTHEGAKVRLDLGLGTRIIRGLQLMQL